MFEDEAVCGKMLSSTLLLGCTSSSSDYENSVRAEMCMVRKQHDSATTTTWVKSERVGRHNRANTIGAPAFLCNCLSSLCHHQSFQIGARSAWPDRWKEPDRYPSSNHRITICTTPMPICSPSRIEVKVCQWFCHSCRELLCREIPA